MSDASDLVLLARVAGSLVVVVLLALLAARLGRRASGVRGGGDLLVRERVGLTREAAAVVLETGGRRLLVGVTPASVSLLADLSTITGLEPEPAAGGENDVSAAPGGGSVIPAPQPAPAPASEPAPTADRAAPPAPRPASDVRVLPLSRKAIRELDRNRRIALPPTQRGTGSVLDPRTWRQGVEALRDLTARRG